MVAAEVKEELIWKWTDLIFANQQNFFNAPTSNKSMNQVISQIGDLITQIGVSKSQLVQGMADSDIDSASRVSWKVLEIFYNNNSIIMPHGVDLFSIVNEI